MITAQFTITHTSKIAGASDVATERTSRRILTLPNQATDALANEAARQALQHPEGGDPAYEDVTVTLVSFP